MSGGEHPEPVRSCVGCRQRRPQSALVRVTRTAVGVVVDGASDGRGAWLCRSDVPGQLAVASCLSAALSRRAFARAWKCDHASSDDETIRALLGSIVDGDEYPDAH